MSQYISHHGIKGMKWGIRNTPTSNRRSSKKAESRIDKESKARAEGWESSYKKRSSMSDADLKKKLTRLQLENNFGQQVRTAKQLSGSKQAKTLFQRMKDVAVVTSKIAPPILEGIAAVAPVNPGVKAGLAASAGAMRGINKVTN